MATDREPIARATSVAATGTVRPATATIGQSAAVSPATALIARVTILSAAAAFLVWPALWNGFPIVFADTGTYLSQAIHRYAGWDRPVFYSLFMLPLHATITVWPVIVAQALLTAWVVWRVCRVLVPGFSASAFLIGIAGLAALTWLPWIVSELMPDLFTPLLIMLLCLLAWVPDRLSQREQAVLAGIAAFMIASQQSSIPLAGILLTALAGLRWLTRPETPVLAASVLTASRRWGLIMAPPVLAVLALCTVNLAAHGRFAIAPFGNVFLLSRVIYDGPGMAVLRRDCPLQLGPSQPWRLCPFLDSFPPNSDDFLWTPDSPLARAGGAKAVSQDAGAIIAAALIADPVGEARAALANALEQLTRFDSGDGLTPWPAQVTPWITHDFPGPERGRYATARQQEGRLSVPPLLALAHRITALAGVIGCAMLLPFALRRRAPCAGFLLAVLLGVLANAAITGSLSAPHDRYGARMMWLPPFIAVVSALSLAGLSNRRRRDPAAPVGPPAEKGRFNRQ